MHLPQPCPACTKPIMNYSMVCDACGYHPPFETEFARGYRAGQAAMRERAAELMATHNQDEDHKHPEVIVKVRNHGSALRATAIRALPVEDGNDG